MVQSHAAAIPSAPHLSNKIKLSKDFSFMGDLLAALKVDGVSCTNYKRRTGVLGVREEGACNFNKQSLTIDLFADHKTGISVIQRMKSLASGYLVGLSNWTINIESSATAKILVKELNLTLY